MWMLIAVGVGILGYVGYKKNAENKQNTMDSMKKVDRSVAFYPFSQWYTYGTRTDLQNGETAEITFTNKETGEKKTIVNKAGLICNFPGFATEKIWTQYLIGEMPSPTVHYRTDIERYNDEKYIMIWEIQPDGRFWADETGFGSENDSEIRLYTFIDKNGDFTDPFKVYNIGNDNYFKDMEKH